MVILTLLIAALNGQDRIAHKTSDQHPNVTRHELVINAGRNAYAAVGYGTYRTVNCIVTSDGPAIVENGAKAWITFLDSEGNYEGDCQLDVRK